MGRGESLSRACEGACYANYKLLGDIIREWYFNE